MNLQISFQGRTLGFYLGLAGGILTIFSAVYYALGTDVVNPLVLVPVIVVILLQVSTLFFEHDLQIIAAPVLCAVSLCAFMIDSIGSLVDYFWNIRMFGDVSMVGFIARLAIVLAIALILLIVCSYMDKKKA